MFTSVYIDKIEDVMQLIADQQRNAKINRLRSGYYYRGQLNTAHKMRTSLYRNCGERRHELESSILRYFTKYASIEDPTLRESVWRQMIEGQHNGLPTRLLDWTHSALVGLHFAMSETDLKEMDKHDCCVWRIDMAEMVAHLPQKYRNIVESQEVTIFSVDTLAEATGNSLKQYDKDMGDSAMVVMEPPSINQRIVNQYSFFSVVPMAIDDIEDFLNRKTENTIKYIINKDLRWRIRDMLDQLNMSERIVYPGLPGLCKWISRHYYVRD